LHVLSRADKNADAMASKTISPVKAAQTLRQRFETYRQSGLDDPLLNPVRKLASEIFLALETGAASEKDIARIVSNFNTDSFEARAREFHRRRSPEQTGLAARLDIFDGAEFAEFQRKVEQAAVGVVFTAHPTFALGAKIRELIAQFPLNGGAEELRYWRAAAVKLESQARKPITLRAEHEEATLTIENARNAVGRLNRAIFEYARARYSKKWRTLTPNPVSLSTWVGYDLDGRTDIHWGESVRIRLAEKAAQIKRYADALENISDFGPDAELEELRRQYVAAAALTQRQSENFAGALDNPEIVIRAANSLTHSDSPRIVSVLPAIKTLTRAIERETDDAKAMALCLLRAEMNAFGLGIARIHLRVNAAQVRSALRADLGLDPDSGFEGRSALDVASRKAKSARLHAVNFGSVFLEQMTARRQFMLCAQILKHIDADTPIRFLIAECEAPATIMGAVYLAKLYGVDHKLDISPLFETPQALEGGGRFIGRLLDLPEYRDYVRARGQMTIQIGYSDSGRFMGQCAASLAAERLQVLFAKALGKAELGGVDALIFNTHGESMGRGAHPGDFRKRLNHLVTPWVNSRFRKERVRLKCEYSFQGGEGFLHFQTPELSAETIDMIWAHANESPRKAADRFYDDINYSWDVYRALKSWQEALFDREDYRRILFSFPQSLLYQTGSRKTTRPGRIEAAAEIRSMRAIPHNAILQQLAMAANVSGGIGVASGKEPDRFAEHVRGSARMRELMEMAFAARALTSISILRAYAGLYSPSYWSSLAGGVRKSRRAEFYESVLRALERQRTAESFDSLANFLAHDLRAADLVFDGLADCRNESIPAPGPNLSILHALRQALIARAASLTARTPAFSRRHDIDLEDLIDMTLQLRLSDTARALRAIFPKESPAEELMTGLAEPIDDGHFHARAYPEIHETIIEPIDHIDRILRQISRAIANFYGAYG
jgi:phosphoenolpyruvate carboxylase